MEVDKRPSEKPGNKIPQVPTNEFGSNITKTADPGTIAKQVSTKLVEGLLKSDITVQLGPLLEISPSVRQNLLNVLKPPRGAARQIGERKEKVEEKTVLGSNLLQPWSVGAVEIGSEAVPQEVPEVRDGLLEMDVKIGQGKFTGIFDSGSQLNVLSEQCAKRCGLPIQTKNLDSLKVAGIGGLVNCVGIIPKANILLTESEVQTVGQPIAVIRDANFELLLGRPWGTRNKANLCEEPEGSLLYFNGPDGRYFVNLSPSQMCQREMQEAETAWQNRRAGRTRRTVGTRRVGQVARRCYAMRAVRQMTTVPDSEEEDQNSPKEKEEIDQTGEEFFEEPAQCQETIDDLLRDRGEAEELEVNKENWSVGQEDKSLDEEQDKEDDHWIEPPPDLYSDQGTSDAIAKDKSIEIELELRESYIKMVQSGMDESEWNQFRNSEKMRIEKDKSVWKKWKKNREALEVPIETGKNSTAYGNQYETQEEDQDENQYENPPIPSEASGTLKTPEPTQPPPNRRLRSKKTPKMSEVTAERRSRRVRRESRKARESDEWQAMKRSAFERDERLTRRSARAKNCAVPKEIFASFGLRLIASPLDDAIDELAPEEREERRDTHRESPTSRNDGPTDPEIDEPRSPKWTNDIPEEVPDDPADGATEYLTPAEDEPRDLGEEQNECVISSLEVTREDDHLPEGFQEGTDAYNDVAIKPGKSEDGVIEEGAYNDVVIKYKEEPDRVIEEDARKRSMIEEWIRDKEKYEEKTYQCGSSLFTRQNLARPANSKRSAAKIRPFRKIPRVGKFLDEKGNFNENQKHPTLTRDELRSVIEWCDNLPENSEGGKEFFIHQVSDTTIAITEIGGGEDNRVLEGERAETGELMIRC